MALPQIVSSSSGKNNGSNSFEITPPAGIQNGDLLVVVMMAGSASAYSEEWLTRGWWRLYASDVNTRQFAVSARIYSDSTPSSVYTIPLMVSANTKWFAMAIRNHGVSQQSDIVIGASWRRLQNGGSQGVVTAPSITTPGADYLALAVTGEASNAQGTHTVPTPNFTFLGQIVESTTNGFEIEWITAWYKEMVAAGATGAQTLTWGTVVSGNGVGIQIAIPPGVAVPIGTGLIGMHAPVGPSSNSISVGFDKLGGSVVEVALTNPAGTELARQTASSDTTTGWGNATFSGLTPNTAYRVRFYVDGVLQTDAALYLKTLPVGASSYVIVAGSCQFTGSNHPVFDRIREDLPLFVAHMGDLHYGDATTEAAWRAAHESSFAAPRFKQLFENTFLSWAPDNHDRIITNPTGTGTGLNLGETDPNTALEWKYFAGNTGWASADTLGRTWVAGRVRYIQTDAWSVRDDGDGDPAPRTFLGAAQKQWFKDTLAAAQEPLIIWFCQWTATNHANGRWNSYPEESSELEAFINARPDLKRRMVLVGGDSHGLQADDGSRVPGNHRFAGIPSLNVSGFNRSTDNATDGQTFWTIANSTLRPAGQLEADWGGYSRITINDDGMHIRFLWEAMRVNASGTMDRVAFYTRSYGSPYDRVFLGDISISSLNVGDKTLWQEPYYGATI